MTFSGRKFKHSVAVSGSLAASLLCALPACAAQGVKEAALPSPAAAEPEQQHPADVIGEMQTYTARYEDTLPDIAVRFDLGFVELKAANPNVNTWVPGEGTQIVLPMQHLLPDAPHKGIVVNVTEMRLYFYAPDGSIRTYPIGIGRDGWATPVGTTRVMRKAVNPIWYPPASIRKDKPELPVSMPSGPDNPLGYRAMYLGWPGYLMHGTNMPGGVGRRASHGCIRLYESDVEKLYPMVKVGTPVTSVNQEVKAAWINGDLYVEVHPSIKQAIEIEEDDKMTPEPPEDLVSAIVKVTDDTSRVDWDALKRAGLERRGYPVKVSR